MYLRKLTANNFRSFDQIEIPLYEDLTVLVGENNGGKSNAIDALRLLTLPLNGRRELYCESTDVRFGSVRPDFPRRPPKVPHLWPPKLLHPAGGDLMH